MLLILILRSQYSADCTTTKLRQYLRSSCCYIEWLEITPQRITVWISKHPAKSLLVVYISRTITSVDRQASGIQWGSGIGSYLRQRQDLVFNTSGASRYAVSDTGRISNSSSRIEVLVSSSILG